MNFSKYSSGFVVFFWSSVFSFLRKLSLFSLLRNVFKESSSKAWFSELWTVSNCFLAFCSVIVAIYVDSTISGWLSLYGLFRIFEIFIYQTNVLLFDEYRANASGQEYFLVGYRRIVLLLLHNYFEIIFWFAATYLSFEGSFVFSDEEVGRSIVQSIYSSFIFSIGEPSVISKNTFGDFVLLFHFSLGFFMTLLSLARFISLLPQPREKA